MGVPYAYRQPRGQSNRIYLSTRSTWIVKQVTPRRAIPLLQARRLLKVDHLSLRDQVRFQYTPG